MVKLSIQETEPSPETKPDTVHEHTDIYTEQGTTEQEAVQTPAVLLAGVQVGVGVQETRAGVVTQAIDPQEEEEGEEEEEALVGALGAVGLDAEASCQADLFSDFNSEGQQTSLQNMQCVLIDSSEYVLTTLKKLVLKVHKKKRSTLTHLNIDNKQPTAQFLEEMEAMCPYQFFAFTNSYKENFEEKTQSGQAGVNIKLISGNDSSHETLLSLVYDFDKNRSNEYGSGQRSSQEYSVVKSKVKTHGLAAVLAFNPNEKGITGSLACYYSAGSVKNIRHVNHGQRTVVTKGVSNLMLTGWLMQFGYNMFLARALTVTPYIESVVSTVGWDSFKERGAIYPCIISKNKNCIVEKSIGLKTQYLVTKNSWLHAALYHVRGTSDIDKLISKTILASMFEYTTQMQSYKKRYSKVKMDLSYEVGFTDFLRVGVNSSICLRHKGSMDKHFITTYFEYIY